MEGLVDDPLDEEDMKWLRKARGAIEEVFALAAAPLILVDCNSRSMAGALRDLIDHAWRSSSARPCERMSVALEEHAPKHMLLRISVAGQAIQGAGLRLSLRRQAADPESIMGGPAT